MRFVSALLFFIIGLNTYLFSCSEMLLMKTGKNVVSGRIMDFEFDFNSKFVPIVAGTKLDVKTEDGLFLETMTTKYGFVGINTLEKPFFSDGLNTEGLSIAALWLVETKYGIASENPDKKNIPLAFLPYYILGQCKNINDVKSFLEKAVVTKIYIKELNTIPPLHLILHDRNGNSLVVEFINGKTVLYDNAPIITNSPTYDIQLSKLNEHKKLIKKDPSLFGIYGISKILDKNYCDERFLLLNFLNEVVDDSKTVQESITNIFRLLGRVNIAKHEWASYDNAEGSSNNMWTVVRDHLSCAYYFKSYKNELIQMVDINKLLADPNQEIRLTSGEWFKEVTK